MPWFLVKLPNKDKPTNSWQVCLEQMVEATLFSADLLCSYMGSRFQPDWITAEYYQGIYSNKEVYNKENNAQKKKKNKVTFWGLPASWWSTAQALLWLYILQMHLT